MNGKMTLTHDCKHARAVLLGGRDKGDKALAHRRERRHLSRATARVSSDVEAWWDEAFEAAKWTGWDIA